MAVWEFATVLGVSTPVPPVRKYTVGATAVVAGQPVIMTAGLVVAKVGGADTAKIFGVAMGSAPAGGSIEVCLALPNVCFWVPVEATDTPAIGVSYGLSTLMTLDDDNVTQLMVKVIDIDSLRTGYRLCTIV